MDLQNTVVTNITGAVTVYSKKGENAYTESRPCYGLTFCADNGKITYTQNGRDFVEDRFHAVILPAGGNYFLRRDVSGAFPVINFATLTPLCEKIEVLEVRDSEILLESFEEIKLLLNSDGNRAKILSLFYGILAEISEPKDTTLISPALKYISEHYMDDSISNAYLARKCKISEVYFRKLFKEYMGASPKQYVLDFRIQKAKQLLSEGREKIHAIADECGFPSSAHFSRTFKQHTGMTPVEYRSKNRIGAEI